MFSKIMVMENFQWVMATFSSSENYLLYKYFKDIMQVYELSCVYFPPEKLQDEVLKCWTKLKLKRIL